MTVFLYTSRQHGTAYELCNGRCDISVGIAGAGASQTLLGGYPVLSVHLSSGSNPTSYHFMRITNHDLLGSGPVPPRHAMAEAH